MHYNNPCSIEETFLWFLRLKVIREGIIGGVNKNEKTDEKKYYIFKCIYFYVWMGYSF